MIKNLPFRLFLVITAANFALCAHAQATKIITLKDGSVIKGEVTQLSDGVYTLKTPNLGDIRVPEAEVVSLVAEGAAQTAQSTQNESIKDQAQGIQASLLSDPEIMTEIQNIMQDPEIRGVLSDPAFMNAIFSYNPDQIRQNEKTQNLLQNPKFRSLIEKVRKKLPASR